MTAVKSTNTGLPLQHNLLALDVSSGNLKWQKPDDGQTGLATVGQGLLAGDRVYWPTSTGLIVVDQEWGEFVTSDKRIQGNLAAADGCLAAADWKPYDGSFTINQVGCGLGADERDLVPGHQQFRAEQRPV